MKKLRYLGLICSTTTVLIPLIHTIRMLLFKDQGLWIVLSTFLAVTIASIISLIFLRWAKPIDQLEKGLTIGKAVLDEKLEDSREDMDKVLGLKDFAPIKFWVVISIIANLFIGGVLTYILLLYLKAENYPINLYEIVFLTFIVCLYASSMINIIILARIHLYKTDESKQQTKVDRTRISNDI